MHYSSVCRQQAAEGERYEDYLAEDTIMLDLTVIYHGIDKETGMHSATIQGAVNWESPYHRQGISWMPGFKTEDYKEIEVEFKTLKQAKAKIKAALDEVSKLF